MRAGEPTQFERVVSHAVVAMLVGAVLVCRKSFSSSVGAALVAVVVHEALDAPVANLLVQLAT